MSQPAPAAGWVRRLWAYMVRHRSDTAVEVYGLTVKHRQAARDVKAADCNWNPGRTQRAR